MIRSVTRLALAGSVVAASILVVGSGVHRAPVQPASAASASSDVRSPPLAPSIRVEGEIVGVHGNGLLTVRVGGVVQAEQGAVAGPFAIDVAGSRTSGMVTIEYTQPGVRFNSTVGSYARMARLAGTDSRLTLDDCGCARISPVSSALQLLVTRAIGHLPANDIQFDNAIRTVTDDLIATTVVVARLADDPALLPAGRTSGLDLLEDYPAFQQFLEDTNFEVLQAEYAGTLEAIPTGTMDATRLPARFAVLGPLLDVTQPTATSAMVIERVAGTTYKIHGFGDQPNLTFTGHFDAAGAFVLKPDRRLIYRTARVFPCPGTSGNTSRETEILSYEFRRHWSGGAMEIWLTSSAVALAYPECEIPPPAVFRNASFGVVADLSLARLSSARPSQAAALPTFCDESAQENGWPLAVCEYAIHAFGRDGRGEIRELGMKVDDAMQPTGAGGRAPLTWNIGRDGTLNVQAGAEHARYWTIDRGDGAALGVVYVAEADRGLGNISLSGYTPMIRVTNPAVYATVSPLGAWSYSTVDVVNRDSFIFGPGSDVRFVRDASGRSAQWSGNRPQNIEASWSLANGRLYSTRWRTTGCVPPIAGCLPSTMRYFRPLARVGNLIHGIEEQYASSNSSLEGPPEYHVIRTASRGQSQRARELPVPEERSAPASTKLEKLQTRTQVR